MAHHSSNPFPEELQNLIAENIRDSARDFDLGATGLFPQGKLIDDDEGEIKIAVTNTSGKVLINFGKPVAWIGFLPDQADLVAESLIKHAQAVREVNRPQSD